VEDFLPVQFLYSSAKAEEEAVISSQTALCRLGPEKRKSAASIAPSVSGRRFVRNQKAEIILVRWFN